MATSFWLVASDTSTVGGLNLVDNVNYRVHAQTFHAPPAPLEDAPNSVPSPAETVRAIGTRLVVFDLGVYGTSGDNLMANIRALYATQRQTRDAGGPLSNMQHMVLWVKLGGASNYVYFDVVRMRIIPHDPTGNDGLAYDCSIELDCLPYARGDVITDTISGTIVNGALNGFLRSAVPGDVPAVVQVLVTDVSITSMFINRMRICRMSLPNPISGAQFRMWVDGTVAAGATNVVDATALNGQYCSRSNAGGVNTWTAVAKCARPSLSTIGTFDVYCRCRDATNLNDAGQAVKLVADAATNGGGLLWGTWQVGVASISATPVEGLLSNTVTVVAPFPAGIPQSAVIADGFESINFTRWGWNTGANAGGTVTITSTGPIAGSQSAQVSQTAASGSIFANFQQAIVPTSTGIYSIFAYIKPTSLGTNNAGDIFPLLSFYDTAGMVAQLRVATANNAVQLVYRSLAGGTVALATTFLIAAGTTAQWELVYDISGSQPVISLWSGGVQLLVTTDATVGAKITPILLILGCYSGTTNGGTWTFLFDDVVYNQDYTRSITPAIPIANVTIPLAWLPGFNANDHRVYVSLNGGAYKSVNTGSATGSFSLATNYESLATNTPVTVPVNGIQLRAQYYAAGTQQVPSYGRPVTLDPNMGHAWQTVYLGCLDLPPVPIQEGGFAQGWEITVQQKQTYGPASPLANVDCLYMVHRAEDSVLVWYPGLALGVLSQWRIETNRTGYTSAVLESVGGGSVLASLPCIGQFTLGPGDNLIFVYAEGVNGVSDVVNLKYQLTLRIIPRYSFVRGLV